MKNDKNSPAKTKLIRHLIASDPKLNEKTVVPVLNGIERFVKLVQKIYTEPQAKIRIKEKKVNGETIKQRVIDTDLEELKKITRGKTMPLEEVFDKLHEAVTGEKVIRKREKTGNE